MSTVRGGDGLILGFRCHECSNIFPGMWGDICDTCREKERRLMAMPCTDDSYILVEGRCTYCSGEHI